MTAATVTRFPWAAGDERSRRTIDYLYAPATSWTAIWRPDVPFKTLVREDKIFISDRKLVKLYKLFRVRAWLLSGGTVSRDDLRLLAYLGETHQEIDHLREKVPNLLGDT